MMFDIPSLLSGSDNLFKYLFTLGSFMIVISIAYPLQKDQELEIEVNQVNKEVELLNNEIKLLRNKVTDLKKGSKSLANEIDSLKKIEKKSNASQKLLTRSIITAKRSDFNICYNDIEQSRQKIEVSLVVVKYNKSRISLLLNHSSTFQSVFFLLLIVGSAFTGIGLYYWVRSTMRSEKLKSHEINKALEQK